MKAYLKILGTAFVVMLLCSCNRPTDSFERLNPVKARSAPLWMPTLTGYQLSVSNTYWSQREPFEADTLIFHLSITAKNNSKEGAVDQYQLVVTDFDRSRRYNLKFWQGFQGKEAEQLQRAEKGFWLNRERDRGWVKLGNVWLLLVGDAWLIELLAQDYIQQYEQRVHGMQQARKQFGDNAEKAFGFLLEYREHQVAK
jgi:hypothetical protein